MSRESLVLLIGLFACRTESATAPEPAADFARGGSKAGSSITVTDLGLSGAGQDSRAEDIDDQGRIVGWRGPFAGPLRAFLWTPTSPRATTGSAADLGDLDGGAAQARGINAGGQIVGTSSTATGDQHPFLWEGGTIHDLGAPTGSTLVEAMDINDAATRRVAGGAVSPSDRALAWTVSGSGSGFQVTALEILPRLSTSGSFAFALNDAGVVVGYSNLSSGANRPVTWSNPGTGWTLNSLPLLVNATAGVARDVNSAGRVVGHNAFPIAGCNSRAVVWEPGATAATQLPTLSGGACAEAWAVNDAGQISGISTDRRGGFRAVLWKPLAAGGYSVTDLGKVSGTSPQPLGMNEPQLNGGGLEVVGYGHSMSGADHATLWTIN